MPKCMPRGVSKGMSGYAPVGYAPFGCALVQVQSFRPGESGAGFLLGVLAGPSAVVGLSGLVWMSLLVGLLVSLSILYQQDFLDYCLTF